MRPLILTSLVLVGACAGGACGGSSAASSGREVQAAQASPSSPSDAELCRALDAPELAGRTEATRRLSDRHGMLVVGGTEQQMEAIATWCHDTHGTPLPSWLPDRHAPDHVVARDVSVIFGGMFAIDHQGPEEYAAMRARVLASPAAYLAALDEVVASATPDRLAVSMPATLLEIAQPAAPDRAKASARTTLAAYDAVIVRERSAARTYDDATRIHGLERRATAVRLLVSQWDR